jgi:hypothetical protein
MRACLILSCLIITITLKQHRIISLERSARLPSSKLSSEPATPSKSRGFKSCHSSSSLDIFRANLDLSNFGLLLLHFHLDRFPVGSILWLRTLDKFAPFSTTGYPWVLYTYQEPLTGRYPPPHVPNQLAPNPKASRVCRLIGGIVSSIFKRQYLKLLGLSLTPPQLPACISSTVAYLKYPNSSR